MNRGSTDTAPMIDGISTASWRENTGLVVGHLLPNYLQGLFTRNRFWVSLISSLHPDPLSVRFVTGVRKRHGTGCVLFRLGKRETVLLLRVADVRRVLERSPEIYAEPRAKHRGMSRFQPGAVTISRGADWSDRRQFNDAVLAGCATDSRFIERCLSVIQNECKALNHRAEAVQTWNDFARLFERLTLRILFGDSAAADVYLTRTLTKLMRNGNRAAVLPPRRRSFANFYTALQAYLDWPEPNSVAAFTKQARSTDRTRVANQVPHWMFAMNETLATNTARALALIAVHDEVQNELRGELEGMNLSRADATRNLRLLEGCLQEAMRLWPTTPILMREMIAEDALGGSLFPGKTQVLIMNSFHHRDRESDTDADRFTPRRWIEQPIDYRFNHLSNGAQGCAGKQLALTLGTAVLASLLQAGRYSLLRPRLDPGRPMPHAMNYFRVKLVRSAGSGLPPPAS